MLPRYNAEANIYYADKHKQSTR